MIFNDFAFIFAFLPLVLAGFLLAPPRWREPLLLAASLVFYGLAGIEHVIVLVFCVGWVWAFTRSNRIIGQRALLVAAVLGPLAALFYYKYLGFFVRDLLQLPPALLGSWGVVTDKLLPAGISFFTFHLVAFAFDRYRGEIADQPKPAHFALYIAFFPHLVAGPILRYHDVAGSLDRLARFRPGEADFVNAIGYFCFGLAAKVLLADSLSDYVVPLSHTPGALSPLTALYVTAAYSFQIYFDFYGYSLMAMGLAFLFGFSFPRNFDRPYESLNPQEFWRRWHMTLGTWIRDYLYFPLGGNQRYGRNILVVFALCGLWHGAAFQFIVWGIYHGVLVAGYRVVQPGWLRLPRLMQQGITFTLVSLGWILFLFDFSGAGQFAQSLLGLAPVEGRVATLGGDAWVLLAVAAVACFVINPERLVVSAGRGVMVRLFGSAAYASLFVFALLFIDRSKSFIYFRF